ncbi:MAG: hypothetical protein K9J37_03670 [Saprospiraceae bacterium]|nr:hypothetical protein [Saprospiraceae bacterium]MCF8248982.1 hypothetical protein [Saprospiraceae bacterium]MCF8279193.1 hypothetical protein [Bacteroidales bacterium]MCF8310876.1 hypothetical protein [Saprospiraceae bacterium]MCF8439536.1 hypothetical protein [Saprospiraceae bacterium]
MKTNQFFLSLFFVLAFCELLSAQIQVKTNGGKISVHSSWGIPTPDCPFPECQQLFEDIQAQYLPQANELCKDIFVCVTCCYDGYETFALVRIQPNAASCLCVEKAEQVAYCSF